MVKAKAKTRPVVNSGKLASPLPLVEASAKLACLSPRELEVFRFMAEGWKNREIAASLFISPKTLDVHRDHIKHKLDLRPMLFWTAYWPWAQAGFPKPVRIGQSRPKGE